MNIQISFYYEERGENFAAGMEFLGTCFGAWGVTDSWGAPRLQGGTEVRWFAN